MSMRPEFKEYKNQVIDLLEDYNFSFYSKDFDAEILVSITKHQIKDGFLYQESIYRCAVEIMAILLDASKQLEEINKTDDILSSVDVKGTIQ